MMIMIFTISMTSFHTLPVLLISCKSNDESFCQDDVLSTLILKYSGTISKIVLNTQSLKIKSKDFIYTQTHTHRDSKQFQARFRAPKFIIFRISYQRYCSF